MREMAGSNFPAGRETSRTLFFILIHAAVMAGILFFCDVKYEVSDDFVMELLASGAWTGTLDAHLMFCSWIWGKLLNFFYSLREGVSWYFFSQILVSFLSFCCLSYFLARRFSLRMGFLMTIAAAAFFARDLYLLPQFTKTAAAAIVCGGCLFVWGLFENRGKGCILAGAAVTIAGCLIRHNAVFIAGPCLFLYVLSETVRLCRGGDARRLLRIYLAGLALLCAIFGLRWINNMAYEMDEAYRYYMDYSYARAYLVDYPLPEYSVCAEQLEEIGISENDYALLRSWCFADRNVFSLERMQAVLDVVDEYRPMPYTTVWEVIGRFFERGILWYPGTICFLFFAGISLCRSPGNRRILALTAGMTVCLLLYFIRAAHSVYRVEFGYLFSAAILTVYTMGGTSELSWLRAFVKSSPVLRNVLSTEGAGRPSGLRAFVKASPVQRNTPDKKDAGRSSKLRALVRFKWQSIACGLLAAAVLVCEIPDYLPDSSYENLTQEEYREYVDSTFDYSWDYLPEKYTKSVNQRDLRPDFWQEVQEHPENLYLLDFNTTIQSLYYEFSPFDSFSRGELANMIYLGGVTVNHPVIEAALEQWGSEEALPMLLRDHVYFVSNTTSAQVLTYLQEHYDADATVSLYGTAGGYQIWSYRPGIS